MRETAEVLLSAHVQHELSRCRGEAFKRLLETHLASTFIWLKDVRLDDVATREQIVGVIDRYVIDLPISGGITELAGEMARKVISAMANRETKLDQVLQPTSYEEFTEKLVALGGVRQEMFSRLVQSPAFGVITSRIFARGLVDLVLPWAAGTGSNHSGLSGLVSRLEMRVAPGLERQVEALLSGYIERVRARLERDRARHLVEALDADYLRSMLDDVWDDLSRKSVADVFALISDSDLEDFVVLCHEFWLRFRKTPYLRQILVEQVDHFFSKYGDESLYFLIEDMGVTEQMVASELEMLLEPLFVHAVKTGFLEQLIRAHLEPFYRSPALAAILESSRSYR